MILSLGTSQKVLRTEITRFYASDPQLLEQYHILAPCNIQEAVNHTVNAIEKCHQQGGATLVCKEYYLTFINNLLFAFFILPEYRKTHKKEFLSLIDELGLDTACIWEKNKRGKLFFERNKFKFVERKVDTSENQIYLIYASNSITCSSGGRNGN